MTRSISETGIRSVFVIFTLATLPSVAYFLHVQRDKPVISCACVRVTYSGLILPVRELLAMSQYDNTPSSEMSMAFR